jgi:hypothetical protein
MRKIGLVFEERDLEKFRAHVGFDLLLLPPGFSLTTNHSATTSGIDCQSLSEFIENGEISKLSRQVAPAVRSLMSRLRLESVEANSSQNDLYQYHLRLQWLYVVALDRFLNKYKDAELWVAIQPYLNYNSPMRPEMGFLYSNSRLLAYLASTLASYKCKTVRTLDVRNFRLVHFADTTRRIARKLFFKLLLSAKLVQKTLHARKRSYVMTAKSDALLRETIGIIVRTDSEVISASYLIRKLQGEGIPYCVIHDEIISSNTTLARLERMGISCVSIGSMLGLRGLWRTWVTKAIRLDLNAPSPSSAPWSHAEQVLLRNEDVLNHLKDRLHDFRSIQLHFRMELEQIIDRYQIGLLVTYAYVDQWGGVIKTAGDRFGIKTLAIQNAAQDPEEYPRLCWADFYCVESQHLKLKLIALGYPGEKLAATGLPQFSSISPQATVRKDEEKSRYQLLILTQPIYQAYFDTLIDACAGFAKDHGVNLAIKYHPRQQGNEYDKVIQKHEDCICINVYRNEALDDLIQQSSAVISIVSAALIRSINIGTPTISYLPMEERHLDLYYANNANLYCVSNISELTVLLKQIKSDETGFKKEFERRRNHYLKEHASYEPTGSPEDNIVMYLKNILIGEALQ